MKSRDFKITLNGKEHYVKVEDVGDVGGDFSIDDVMPTSEIERDVRIRVGAEEYQVRVKEVGVPSILEEAVPVEEAVKEEVVGEAVCAPMQGTVIRISVNIGDKVEPGDVVAVLEAMKMENDIESTVSGVVRAINVSEGDTVATGDVLVIVD